MMKIIMSLIGIVLGVVITFTTKPPGFANLVGATVATLSYITVLIAILKNKRRLR
jgi:hypothetical protein